MSVRREFLDEAGYFDENYKGWGMEDTDLVYRLQKNKGTIKNK
ncbi:galactosyltransferase-related protein [Thermobacillus sp.]